MKNDIPFAEHALPPLPEPVQRRWQPLRIGLVELFHYDCEEFWFRNGRLLLRGNNGTGKSKVLSLTLPFLFDAELRSSRIEPDGDPTKKMAWNLLLGKYEKRIGYTWIEFGRVVEGQPEYLTLGCGLSAVDGRANVDSWFFLTENQRIGRDISLINAQRSVLTRDRLETALFGHGQVFPTAAAYRRAVDERLFHLGEVRYGALMDTLIQLRQPQLSKRPNEDTLSNALTEALPPLSSQLLSDVADAMNQLEEYRIQLSELDALKRAMEQFNRRYRIYASIGARRRAAVVRSAQTNYDYASRALKEAREQLETATQEEQNSRALIEELEQALLRERAALDELRADPAMQDARRLEEMERNAVARKLDVEKAETMRRTAGERLDRAIAASRKSADEAERAQDKLTAMLTQIAALARTLSIDDSDSYVRAYPVFTDLQLLSQIDEPHFTSLQSGLRQLATRRRDHLALLRKRLHALDIAEHDMKQEQRYRDERADELADSTAHAIEAQKLSEQRGLALVAAWEGYFSQLKQLSIADIDVVLAALAEWIINLDGENPARGALHAAQQSASQRLTYGIIELERRLQLLEDETARLQDERQRLEHGQESRPPAPYQRHPDARNTRPGAPLWQLIEFDDHMDSASQAGLEAALEAAGLLDAWVMPDGALLKEDTFDTWLIERPAQGRSLASCLMPVPNTPVPENIILRLLQGIACAETEVLEAEAWVSPNGQFRIGPMSGAWKKPSAEYIGFAAREAARQRRLLEAMDAIDANRKQSEDLERQRTFIHAERQEAEHEWQNAPADEPLRAAQAAAIASDRQRRTAAEKLVQADAQLLAVERRLRDAGESLAFDADDLGLPSSREELHQIEQFIQQFESNLHTLLLAAQGVRLILPAYQDQERREAEARGEVEEHNQNLEERKAAAEEVASRLEILRESVGAKVEELTLRLSTAQQAVQSMERTLKTAQLELTNIVAQRARHDQRMQDCSLRLTESGAARQGAIENLQTFASFGLLAVALPELGQAVPSMPWTIESALTLARRAEQELSDIRADDSDWTRIQNEISRDYTELQRTLTVLHHQAQAEMNDVGLIVTVIYQNRAERPDLIEARVSKEIAQRKELLTLREREILENHLQAEVAAAVQRLLQESESHVIAINKELEKRPTSTGVKFRLVWQLLPEGSSGENAGIDAEQRRLFNTNADAWSPEERREVGAMLHSRITSERIRTDAEGGGSLLDILARALDYRRWHRFRVQRWQDGQWRPLSGPASSGERALGLTVPLFAAVSSFYSRGEYADAPRLVLLDEAFAGIDDAARAHCMALIREFDLDFVMTSEREWGCYAELPGVSICQLQRREGIDAVYVSRWSWNGRARRAEEDGVRRFPASDKDT